jgi:hypothetical protein
MSPEEQDVHDDHDGYHREHVQRDSCLPSHRSVLLLQCSGARSAPSQRNRVVHCRNQAAGDRAPAASPLPLARLGDVAKLGQSGCNLGEESLVKPVMQVLWKR